MQDSLVPISYMFHILRQSIPVAGDGHVTVEAQGKGDIRIAHRVAFFNFLEMLDDVDLAARHPVSMEQKLSLFCSCDPDAIVAEADHV